MLIDPEGEFATLRERFGYVLAGKGGETPADVRSAALVAHKLLELHASAVCDLYEMKPGDRHRWVRLFLEALIDAPKRLWQPLIVIVDEAHLFVPEKGSGESEAADAMISLSTRGRKRGFCAVWATQRLAKVRKDAAAELQNVLIGSTFIDVDRKRAAEALGIQPADMRGFFDEIKLLESGNFWALGRALALERTLVKVGPVVTTHPEPGSSKHAAEPPPPPEKVKALLPKLADLPQEAEKKAQTEADLRAEVRALKAQLLARPTQIAEKIKERRVEVEVVKPAMVREIERAAASVESLIAKTSAFLDKAEPLLQRLGEQRARLEGAVTGLVGALRARQAAPSLIVRAGESVNAAGKGVGAWRPPQAVPESRARVLSARGPGDPEVGSGGLRRILLALAQHPEGLAIRQIGVFAGVSITGGSFSTWMSRGRTAGWIVSDHGGLSRLTDEGLKALGSFDPLPTGADLLAYWLREMGEGGDSRILRVIAEAYPDSLSNEEIGRRANVSVTGGSFSTWMSRLRTRQLIVNVGRGQVRAAEELFG